MALLPISLQVMIRGLYDTTVEFFALRHPTPPPGGQSSGPSHSNLRTLNPVPDPIGKLTQDCTSLQQQLDAPRDSGPPHMRRGLENITNQLARSQAEVARLEERCRMLEKALKGTREMLEARESELDRVRKSISENSQESLPRSVESTSMLEEERAQMRGNEVFMSRIDSMSGAQVVQFVNDLNSEIIQFAASAIELCTIDPTSPTSSQAMQDTSARLGSKLAGLLSARERNSQDPTLVGLALQAGISAAIARSMSSFALGLPSKSDVILSHLYSHVFGSEPQPTSSRWRALTHKYVHALYPGLKEYSAEELRETICRWTSDILVAAGATQEGTSRAWIRETFGDQIGRMVKAVARMAQICKEEIMSTNFDIVCPEPGQFFDERIMTDAFGEYGVSQGAILATTELGLRRMTRRGYPDARTVEQQLLVRPKIILDSVGTTFT